MSIPLGAPTWRDRLRERLARAGGWLKRLGAPELPSYQRSREELGGVPWRRFDETDAWFLQSSDTLKASPPSGELPAVVVTTATPRSGETPQRSQPALRLPPPPSGEHALDLRTPFLSRNTILFAVGFATLAVAIGVAASKPSAPIAAPMAVPAVAQATAPSVPVASAPVVAKRVEPSIPAAASHHRGAHKPTRHARRH